ncbi:hypothetical protein [Ensifer sp. BR816]|uniref:hypothetical protein n=1 Tax=Rhizobium sp. (strain BR816) TaxID=1057002 RepID=UPI000476C77A|nr:hypothetical protein [Ensifer sp. BR816]
MKTPWKFLVQLTSRRPSAKAQEMSIGHDSDPEALASEAEETSKLPSDAAEAASPPHRDEDVSVDHVSVAPVMRKADDDVAQALKPPIAIEEAQTAARNEADHAGAEANSLVPESTASTQSQNKPRIKRREGRKKAKARVAVQNAVAPKEKRSVQPASSRDLFFHDVAILDEEIKMLRTQLAQKLYLQNVQLKEMLERFDVW